MLLDLAMTPARHAQAADIRHSPKPHLLRSVAAHGHWMSRYRFASEACIIVFSSLLLVGIDVNSESQFVPLCAASPAVSLPVSSPAASILKREYIVLHRIRPSQMLDQQE